VIAPLPPLPVPGPVGPWWSWCPGPPGARCAAGTGRPRRTS